MRKPAFHRYRAAFIALVFSVVTAVWLWNWTAQISDSYSSTNLLDVPQHERPSVADSHIGLDAAHPADVANVLAQQSALIERLLPASRTESWMVPNRAALRNFMTCLESNDCRPNQRNLVILTSDHFRAAWDGGTSGEAIWAAAVVLALNNLGYTYFYASSLAEALPLYQAFPSHVRVALADDHDLEPCLSSAKSSSPSGSPCAQSASFPSGIPPYKVLAFMFWSRAEHPFGAQWTLSPEDYKALGDGANTYLGYSIEATCTQHRFVPHAERSANEAYILAKLLSFFLPERDCVWNPEMLNAATRDTGIVYIGGSYNDTQTRDGPAPKEPEPMWNVPELPQKYTNEGRRPQFEFLERLAGMRVLIGMGHPMTSPTPYDALCLGVPFINPIGSWDPENPTDRSRWWSQHPPLSRLDPPYVYNVFENDLEGFVSAIKGAIQNPIQSFIPDSMRIRSVENRLNAILQTDWEGEARRLGWPSKLQ